ncbi:MAG TPA: BadF/BadG/BcrA/BcrD ATPase family protein [Kaistia sp.]|nr:BadF/BadG/BcrA/BcrD ATPase family protein [Kaistia sp.]
MDIGGSKSHVRIEDLATGAMISDVVRSNTGWAALTDLDRAAVLGALLHDILRDKSGIAAIVAGVHGSDSPQQAAILRSALAPFAPIASVINDSSLLVPAYGLSSGTGVTAGTGSSATASEASGHALTVGGWGWVLGDEGGAVGIVRDAAKQVLSAYDNDESDLLSARLLAALGVEHPHGLGRKLATTDPRLWARIAHLVFDASADGSPRAREVIESHGQALAAMVALLARRGGDIRTVVCGGGLMTRQPALFDAFAGAMKARFGHQSNVVLLTGPPVAGAIHLARQVVSSTGDKERTVIST